MHPDWQRSVCIRRPFIPALLGLAVLSCGGGKRDLTLIVHDDESVRVPGVVVRQLGDDLPLGRTDARGLATVEVVLRRGEPLRLRLASPEGTSGPLYGFADPEGVFQVSEQDLNAGYVYVRARRAGGASSGEPESGALAGLALASEPSGAVVQVNGEERGRTPLLIPDLPPGRATLELRLDGYELWRREIVLFSGENADTAVLQRSAIAGVPPPGAPGSQEAGAAAGRSEVAFGEDGAGSGSARETAARRARAVEDAPTARRASGIGGEPARESPPALAGAARPDAQPPPQSFEVVPKSLQELTELRVNTGRRGPQSDGSVNVIYVKRTPGSGRTFLRFRLDIAVETGTVLVYADDLRLEGSAGGAPRRYYPFDCFLDAGFEEIRGSPLSVEYQGTLEFTFEVPRAAADGLELHVLGRRIGSVAEIRARTQRSGAG